MPGYEGYDALLARLGKHETGKARLYITKMANIDEAVLGALIAPGLQDLDEIWLVHPA